MPFARRHFALCALVCLMKSVAASATTTATTLTVTQAGSPVSTITAGSSVTLTATVLAGSTTVTPGVVNFCDATAAHCTDIHILGSAQLTSAGTAAIRFVPGIGSHSYKAVFIGTNTNTASTSSTASLTVAGVNSSTTSISSSGNPSSLTLTATVGGVGSIAPSGTVSFLDTSSASTVLGTATLGAGTQALNFILSSTPTAPLGSTLATGDFNNDGHTDLITQDGTTRGIQLLLGNGNGTFTNGVEPSVDSYVLAVGDFNGDGNADIITGNTSALTLLLGNGDGTFATGSLLAAGNFSSSIIVQDFNGDGNADLAVTSPGADDNTTKLTILLGNGKGTFSPLPAIEIPGVAESFVATGDFNGDGKPDLVLTPALDDPDSLTLLLGNGDGTFSAAAGVALDGYVEGITVADFNGDGNADLAVSTDSTGGGGSFLTVFLGAGNGTFTSSTSLALAYGAVTVGDFNGDGFADIAVGSLVATTVPVFLGDGTGNFTAAPNPIALGGISDLVTADFNGDGLPDLALLTQSTKTYEGMVFSEVASTRSATATATGVSLLSAPAKQTLKGSYPGDRNYAASVSAGLTFPTVTATLVPAVLNFPATYAGDSSGYQKVTFTNTGTASLVVGSFNVAVGTDFGVRDQTCGSTLAAGAACTFNVVFKPQECCSLTDYIDIYDNTQNNPQDTLQQVVLHGVGKAASIGIRPLGLNFPDTSIGSTAGYRQITVYSNGNLPLTIRSIAITNTTDFYSWGIRDQTCGSTLAAGATCTFSVAFRPTRTGAITAEVSVDDTVGTWQQKILLTGTGK